MIRKREYKPLLFTTTVRNPMRIKSLLYILCKYDNRILTNNLACEIIGELIRYGLYRPTIKTDEIRHKWQSTNLGEFADEILSDSEVNFIMRNNPQNHKEAGFDKGWASRFATYFDFAKELGFVYFKINERIEFSQMGKMLAHIFDVEIIDNKINVKTIHPEYEQQVFLQTMAKSQRMNPFVGVLNDNIPMLLLIKTIKKLNANPAFNTISGKTKGISKKELPLLIFWKDNNADTLYQRIVQLRKDYGYDPSDEIICDICTDEIMGGFKKFKTKSIISEYPDEFIRKMRITGLFSLRGAGRFLDLNYNEIAKIDYVVNKYSNYKHYNDEHEYFEYMSAVDNNLLNTESISITKSQSDKLLENWLSVYTWTDIKRELEILAKRRTSNDNILKFINAPERLEFLTALSIKTKLPQVMVCPNYKCDDTGLPTSTAGGGVSDIICQEGQMYILVEVTMAEGRTQTVMEIWPITRHLEEFIENKKHRAQAMFIAPSIFADSQKQINYVRDTEQIIIKPYKIADFINLLENNKSFNQITC